MNATVTENKEAHRYEISVDGVVAGFAEYRRQRDVIALPHTEIDSAYSGKGLASKLIRYALDDARSQGLSVRPFCPFVQDFMVKHPDYRDLVVPEERERFGL